MSFLKTATRRFLIAGDLLAFFWSSKWWWVTPIIVVFLLFSILLILGQSSAIAPFIYTIF